MITVFHRQNLLTASVYLVRKLCLNLCALVFSSPKRLEGVRKIRKILIGGPSQAVQQQNSNFYFNNVILIEYFAGAALNWVCYLELH